MSEKATVLSWRGSDKYYNPYIGRGEVLFTGKLLLYNRPDGIRDHQATVLDPNTYVGIGTMSPEGTSNLNYLWRPSRVGEIGWGLQFYTDYQLLRSGHQIKLGEFRQSTEDRHTHLYQNPWYPGPNDEKVKDTDKGYTVITQNSGKKHKTTRKKISRHY
ncbi:Uncharacterized protein P5673_002024 [Acropora cervicornis]|uniref:Uncharacterized protein n=1 Tax=Acropora cervicornis TaxID=6130 RepID=A0AAD9VGE6_ACRCE|nr:Uncharacterized protein P5673_002024 [Acropora cervicornis]